MPHDAFWSTVGAGAPVLGLAQVFLLSQLYIRRLRVLQGNVTEAVGWCKAGLILLALNATLCFLLPGTIFFLTLRVLSSESDRPWQISFSQYGLLYSFLGMFLNPVGVGFVFDRLEKHGIDPGVTYLEK